MLQTLTEALILRVDDSYTRLDENATSPPVSEELSGISRDTGIAGKLLRVRPSARHRGESKELQRGARATRDPPAATHCGGTASSGLGGGTKEVRTWPKTAHFNRFSSSPSLKDLGFGSVKETTIKLKPLDST